MNEKRTLVASVLFSNIASHPNSLQCSHNSLHLPINECLVPKSKYFFITFFACDFYPVFLFIVLHQNSWIPQPRMLMINLVIANCLQYFCILQIYSTNVFFEIAQILQLIQSQILAVLSHLCFCRAMFFSSHRINALRSALEKAQQKPTSRAGENIEPFYSKLDIQKGQAFPKNPHYTVIIISRNLLCNKLCALYSMNNMQICATVSGRHFLIFNLSWFE